MDREDRELLHHFEEANVYFVLSQRVLDLIIVGTSNQFPLTIRGGG